MTQRLSKLKSLRITRDRSYNTEKDALARSLDAKRDIVSAISSVSLVPIFANVPGVLTASKSLTTRPQKR